MHGFQTSDVALDILADFHFEEAKPLRVPSARQGDGLVEIGVGNRNIRLPRPHIRATPELPHWDVRRPAIGIDDGGFESSPCVLMCERHFRYPQPALLVPIRMSTQILITD